MKIITETDTGDKTFYPLIQKDVAYEVNGVTKQLVVVYSESADESIRKALNGVIPEDYVEDEITYTFDRWVQTDAGVYKATFVDASTGIREVAAPHFSVVANGRTLEIANAKMGSAVVVYDMSGRIAARGVIGNANQRLEIVNPGSYVVRVNNQTVRVTVR